MKNLQWSSRVRGVTLFYIVMVASLSSAPIFAAWPHVIFPSDKGITLVKGQTYTIRWGSVRVDPVRILLCEELSDYTECFHVIAENVPNTGSYTWKVPGNLKNASNYTVSVGLIGVSVGGSEYPFRISGSSSGPAPGPSPGPSPSPNAWSIDGTVKAVDGNDLCAMVLASGRFVFTCNPVGHFSLDSLPLEPDGTVVRQVYASGFFPKVEKLKSAATGNVILEPARDCPNYNPPSRPGGVPGSAGKRHSITGRVLLQSTDTPICALVLANGAHMFSCGENLGNFSLNFPLDEAGHYKLQVYAAGFAPSIQTFNEFDNPLYVRMAKAAECRQ